MMPEMLRPMFASWGAGEGDRGGGQGREGNARRKHKHGESVERMMPEMLHPMLA
ncbi:unnamed protein product, partial [Closterium sp. NIES-54]